MEGVITGSDYRAIFKQHIVRRLELVQRRVDQAEIRLSPLVVKQALFTLDYGLAVPEAWSQTRSLLKALAPKMERAGYRDEWRPYLERGIEQAKRSLDAAALAELQLQLGIFWQRRTRYDLAWQQIEASIRHFALVGNERGQARALNWLAYVAYLQRRHEEAQQFLVQARALLPADDPEQAFSEFVEKQMALDWRDWPEAVRWARQVYPAEDRSQYGAAAEAS